MERACYDLLAVKTNVLYYGDNLDILRNHIPDESSNCRHEVIWRDDAEVGHDLLRNFLEM